MKRILIALLIFAAAAPLFAQCVTKTVTCGSSSTDFIGPSSSCIVDSFPTQRYVFNGTAGQKVTFIASNLAGQTIGMQLMNSAGQFISSDFDEPAQITATLPSAGQ
ncbi:MAG TPA: hypothetical protein VN181_09990, partial [Thermoanaerobaculia bacterium]|nr:hypothetical protein [Thermoanaerobaculia bacterium]